MPLFLVNKSPEGIFKRSGLLDDFFILNHYRAKGFTVDAEDPSRPLSDARLSELLAREGIRIARRTVAKYREELHIPSSSIRKVEGGPAGEPE